MSVEACSILIAIRPIAGTHVNQAPPRLRANTRHPLRGYRGEGLFTAAQATNWPSYIAWIMSPVDQESRSTNRGLMCSVTYPVHLSRRDPPIAAWTTPHFYGCSKRTFVHGEFRRRPSIVIEYRWQKADTIGSGLAADLVPRKVVAIFAQVGMTA